jgi:capsular exopolysaccharide synthesis family protein
MIQSLVARTAQKRSLVKGFPDRLVTIVDPESAPSVAFHMLAIGIQSRLADSTTKVIALTSARAMEGKSTTCANLGVALAQEGKRTLILDCDLRKPVMHKIFKVPDLWGTVNALRGECALQETLQYPLPKLSVAPVGLTPPNPVELVSGDVFAKYLSDIRREKFEYVLLDVPAVGTVSDSLIIANRTDGALLVVDAQSTPKEQVWRCRRHLEAFGISVVGVVLNHVKD